MDNTSDDKRLAEFEDDVFFRCRRGYGIELHGGATQSWWKVLLECYARGDDPATTAFLVVNHIQGAKS